MSTLRIVDAPLLPDVDGTEKIPTGGRGDYAISVDQIKDHIFQDVGKELVGLGNVDNTSDLDKPVSTAQQAALNLKADKSYVDTNLNLKADKTNVYTRSETSLALSKKADLVNGVIPENQIPSSFNDVLEFTTSTLPIVGESGKIYVTTDNNKTWRWATNRYVEISGWNPDSVSKVVTLPTYYAKEDGVNSVTGVVNGAYFNVRSTDDTTMLDEYQNVGGSAVATGRSYPSSQAIVEVQQSVAAVDGKLKRENVSVWDFFTQAERQEINRLYLAGTPQLFDSASQIQAFFDYIAANNVGTAYCSGTFYISKDLLLGGANACLTKQVIGNLVLNVFVPNTLVTMIKFQCGRYFNWSGRVEVNGVGGVFYKNRTVMRGVQIGGEYASTANNFDTIVVDGGFIDCGFISANLTSGTIVQTIRASRCGSGMAFGPDGIEDRSRSSLKSNWTRTSDITGTIVQRTTITVAQMPPIDISTALLVRLGANKEQVHVVYSRDDVAKTLTIFPAVDSTLTSGELIYFFGAGVYTTGADGGLVDIKKITANNCSAVHWQNALYPGATGITLGEANAASLVIGSSPSSAHVGGSTVGIYTEGVEFDILRLTRAQLSYSIASNYALKQSKVYDVSNYRTIGTNVITPQQAALSGITIQVEGEYLAAENLPQNGPVTTIDITSKTRSTVVQKSNTKTFTILEPSAAMNNNFGFDNRDVVVFGSSTSGSGIPTGAVVFNAPVDWTVNGESSVSFSNFIRAPRFNLYADFINKNIVITCSDTVISASVTYDPPPLAAGDRDAIQTMTLTGAALGDNVNISFSRNLTGVTLEGYVSAPNTISYYFQNNTTATVDLLSGTVKAKIV